MKLDPDPSIIKQKYDFLSLKIDANVPSKSIKQKNNFSLTLLTKIAGSRSVQKYHGSATLVPTVPTVYIMMNHIDRYGRYLTIDMYRTLDRLGC